jgi:hypothetical protein
MTDKKKSIPQKARQPQKSNKHAPSQPATKAQTQTPQIFMQAYSYEIVFDGKTKKEREVHVQQNSSSKEPKISIIERIDGKTTKPSSKQLPAKKSTKQSKKST